MDSPTGNPTFKVPNGGWLGWSQAMACFLMSFCSLGLLNSFGIFQSYYQHHFLDSYPSSSITWIGTVQGFLFNVVMMATGRLYDTGHAKALVYIGSALNVVGLIATSFSVSYVPVFFSLGLCVGLGSGTLGVPSMAIVATYFDERKRPLATGLAATGAALGGVIYPVLFRGFVDRMGFPWTVRTLASVNAGLLIVACVLIGNEVSTKKSKHQFIDRAAFRDTPFILFSVSMFLLWLGIDVPFFFLPSFAQERLSLSADWGDYLLAMMNASAIAGRVILGVAAMYAGAFATWQFSIGASCILLACWVAVHDLPGIIVVVLFYGMITTGVSSLVSAALLVISPDISVVGTRMGMSGVLGGLGCLIGPPVAGAIQGTSAGYIGLTTFTAAVYLVAFGVLWVAKVLHMRGIRFQRMELKDAESSVVTLPTLPTAGDAGRQNRSSRI
ncbi:major facilitator superfamily domain-containing protein [Cercophora newfieldiana]|uniref:Major facilitator superfamily domain-containing protein n=1 Tax=Cercophora newfieldiana TaxID=92897 RepID=A0AA39YSG1_9PEZI|nr:major facilitator superfamily domain-containing protein [Cercophora newfieldiana]